MGRVEQIWVYPVRSLAGPEVAVAGIGPTGVDGDRAWTVVGDDDAALRAKDAPALADVPGTGDPDADARPPIGAARPRRPPRADARRRPACGAGPPRLPAGDRAGRRWRGARGLLGRRPAGQPRR